MASTNMIATPITAKTKGAKTSTKPARRRRNWFNKESTEQLSGTEGITAFGIALAVPGGQGYALIEQLKFARLAAKLGVANFIIRVSYDSYVRVHNISTVPLANDSLVALIEDAARQTLHFFAVNGGEAENGHCVEIAVDYPDDYEANMHGIVRPKFDESWSSHVQRWRNEFSKFKIKTNRVTAGLLWLPEIRMWALFETVQMGKNCHPWSSWDHWDLVNETGRPCLVLVGDPVDRGYWAMLPDNTPDAPEVGTLEFSYVHRKFKICFPFQEDRMGLKDGEIPCYRWTGWLPEFPWPILKDI